MKITNVGLRFAQPNLRAADGPVPVGDALCLGYLLYTGVTAIAAGTNSAPPIAMPMDDDNVIPFPGTRADPKDDTTTDDPPYCPDDEDGCEEWRELLELQREQINLLFISRKISLAEYELLIKEHNQAVEFYKIECNDKTADSLKLL